MPVLPYGRQSIDEADIAAVVAALRAPRITQGPLITEFEQRVADYCGAKHAIAVANGTAALHVATLASGIGPGDLGLTTPLTFLASANCIAYTGARVGFVDIRQDTLCLDHDALERRCESGDVPRVVVAVDFTGVPCDLPRLFTLAGRYGFTLIEDAAHSLGAAYLHEGRWHRCGGCAHTHLATLSFHPVKAITTGEGGMVLTNDAALAERVRRLACHGIERNPERLSRNDGPWYHEMQELGCNYRITDFQCALGLSQMNKLDGWLERRREIASCYNEAFRGLAEVPPWPEHTIPAFHLYVLRLIGRWRGRRREFFDSLTQHGIQAQVHYIPVHLQPHYRKQFGFKFGDYPVAEAAYARCLSLPMYPAMSDSEVSRVINSVSGILTGKSK